MANQTESAQGSGACVSGAKRGLEILADVVREHYDLGRVHTPEYLPSAHQRRHQKLVIQTSRGRFLAKTYKNDPYVLDALRFQHRLSAHLTQHDLPVAKIQPAKDGRRIVVIDNWALELQQFVEGHAMVVSKKTLAIAGQTLGKFHVVCRDFPRPERDSRMWRFSEVPRETFSKLYEAAIREGTVPGQQINEYCNTIAVFLQEAGQQLNWEARGKFETGLIHGDWHGGNLIFNGEYLQAIVDLEFAGDGCFLEDLSYGLSNLCVRTTMVPERLAKRIDAMLDNYQRYRSLSFGEEAAIYYAVGVKHVATVSYQVQQHPDGLVAGFPPSEWMKRLAFQCQWLLERARKRRFGA